MKATSFCLFGEGGVNGMFMKTGPIGVFDSGYGGLTILSEIRKSLPEYDYIYLGDNARAPYGSRSFDVVYKFTLQAVRYLFSQGCQLVILACNTASAKALRTIQQNDLPKLIQSAGCLALSVRRWRCLAKCRKAAKSAYWELPVQFRARAIQWRLRRCILRSALTDRRVRCGCLWLNIRNRILTGPIILWKNMSVNFCSVKGH